MKLRLDPESPVPLYHQIAEAIRYRIATGAIRPGEQLPPLREAAAEWGVNLHTVRRAYGELAGQRLIETRPPHGTTVLEPRRTPKARRGDAALGAFVEETLRRARDEHGLTRDQFVAALANREQGEAALADAVSVVECSETQAEDLARQIEARWTVRASAWSLERPGAPPAGPVVATYFHYNDVRTRWPERLASVRFVAIKPDASFVERLGARAGADGKTTVYLCEHAPSMAGNIAADLASVLPADRFRIVQKVVEDPASPLAGRRDGPPVLYSPRVWAELEPEQRANPRAVEVRYVFEPADLDALGASFGWATR